MEVTRREAKKTLDRRKRACIKFIEISRKFDRIFLAFDDGQIRLFMPERVEHLEIGRHHSTPTLMKKSRNEKDLVVGYSDGTVLVVDVKAKKVKVRFEKHRVPVLQVLGNLHNNQVISVDVQGKCYRWSKSFKRVDLRVELFALDENLDLRRVYFEDQRKMVCLSRIKPLRFKVVDPTKKRVQNLDIEFEKRAGRGDKHIRCFTLCKNKSIIFSTNRQRVFEFHMIDRDVKRLAKAPKGEEVEALIYSKSSNYVYIKTSRSIKVVLKEPGSKTVKMFLLESPVVCHSLSGNGHILITAGRTMESIRLWNANYHFPVENTNYNKIKMNLEYLISILKHNSSQTLKTNRIELEIDDEPLRSKRAGCPESFRNPEFTRPWRNAVALDAGPVDVDAGQTINLDLPTNEKQFGALVSKNIDKHLVFGKDSSDSEREYCFHWQNSFRKLAEDQTNKYSLDESIEIISRFPFGPCPDALLKKPTSAPKTRTKKALPSADTVLTISSPKATRSAEGFTEKARKRPVELEESIMIMGSPRAPRAGRGSSTSFQPKAKGGRGRKSFEKEENLNFFNKFDMLLNNSKNNISINNSFNMIFENKIESLEAKVRRLGSELAEERSQAELLRLIIENHFLTNRHAGYIDLDLLINNNGRRSTKHIDLLAKKEARRIMAAKVSQICLRLKKRKPGSGFKLLTKEELARERPSRPRPPSKPRHKRKTFQIFLDKEGKALRSNANGEIDYARPEDPRSEAVEEKQETRLCERATQTEPGLSEEEKRGRVEREELRRKVEDAEKRLGELKKQNRESREQLRKVKGSFQQLMGLESADPIRDLLEMSFKSDFNSELNASGQEKTDEAVKPLDISFRDMGRIELGLEKRSYRDMESN